MDIDAFDNDRVIIRQEIEKCKASPYYFATTYLTVNGRPFTTLMTEEDFNSTFIHPEFQVNWLVPKNGKITYSYEKTVPNETQENCGNDAGHNEAHPRI